jgi:hypothetical protein
MAGIGLEGFIGAVVHDPWMRPGEKLYVINEYSKAARLAAEFAAKHDVGYDPEEQTYEQLTYAVARFIHEEKIDLDLINWDGILPNNAE